MYSLNIDANGIEHFIDRKCIGKSLVYLKVKVSEVKAT